MKKTGEVDVVSALLSVAMARTDTSAEAWDYGWCSEEYRRSPSAAATGPHGSPISFPAAAVSALEAAFKELVRDRRVARAWEEEQLWGVVTNLVSTLPMPSAEGALRAEIKARLDQLADEKGTFVAFEVANVATASHPIQIGESAFGAASLGWGAMCAPARRGRSLPSAFLTEWRDGRGPTEGAAVYGTWVNTQGQRARDEAELRFHETVALSLMLEPDLAALRLFSGRGDSHRPGVRGLVIDRNALSRSRANGADLSATMLTVGTGGLGVSTHWWGGDPFPLERLLRQNDRVATVAMLLSQDTNVARRLRTAASWYARAHWSEHGEDAVLALGVAFDALLGERSGLPGRAMSDRFALLEPNSSLRGERAKRFGEFYGARSAIAHGGRSSSLDQRGFERRMATEVRLAAIRLHALTRAAGVDSEEAFRELFEDLKWGAVQG